MSAEELTERRRADRRLRVLDLYETLACEAESGAAERVRALFARRYRALVGVPHDRRHALREALAGRIGVPVVELMSHFNHDD